MRCGAKAWRVLQRDTRRDGSDRTCARLASSMVVSVHDTTLHMSPLQLVPSARACMCTRVRGCPDPVCMHALFGTVNHTPEHIRLFSCSSFNTTARTRTHGYTRTRMRTRTPTLTTVCPLPPHLHTQNVGAQSTELRRA